MREPPKRPPLAARLAACHDRLTPAETALCRETHLHALVESGAREGNHRIPFTLEIRSVFDDKGALEAR